MYYILYFYLFTGFDQSIDLEQQKFVTHQECIDERESLTVTGYTTGDCLPMEVNTAASDTTDKQKQKSDEFIKRYMAMPKVTPPADPYAKPKQPSEAFIEGWKKEMSKPEPTQTMEQDI